MKILFLLYVTQNMMTYITNCFAFTVVSVEYTDGVEYKSVFAVTCNSRFRFKNFGTKSKLFINPLPTRSASALNLTLLRFLFIYKLAIKWLLFPDQLQPKNVAR